MRALWENRKWHQRRIGGGGPPLHKTHLLAHVCLPSDQTSNNTCFSYSRLPQEMTINGRKKKGNNIIAGSA